MCGLAGFYDLNADVSLGIKSVNLMVQSMNHRGPDSNKVSSVNIDPSVVLGHSRLSIIDLSHESDQPMTDINSGNTIVFNGEIYNFKILRKELESAGHSFTTHSDTEVILKSYSEWGPDCCNKFRGIFAFAIWDKNQKKLFIARDQMGVKPFYYYLSDNRLIFGSEVRALLVSGNVPRKLNYSGLESYLAYGSVQEPLTLIDGVNTLPPGCFAYYDNINKLRITRYWVPTPNSVKYNKYDIGEIVREKLRETLELQLISDVPLGVFLSGGIDSSSIVSIVRQVFSGQLKTYSIVFRDPRYDERYYSKLVANRNDTMHTELELTSEMISNNLKNALNDFDQPSLDGLNTWFVSKLVKESGITVALSGVGGDELFIGYDGFKKARFMQLLQPFLSHLPDSLGRSIQKNRNSEQFRRIADMIGFGYPGYFMSRKLFSEYQRSHLLERSLLGGNNWHDLCFREVIEDASHFTDELTRISIYEMRTYMLSTLLRDTDQMSMAHALEVRVPLIDIELVKLLLNLPGRLKFNRSTPKPLLVNASGNGLPQECVYRKKQGFSFPFDQYYRETLGKEILEFFNDEPSLIFEKKELNGIWLNYLDGKVSWSRVWAILTLSWWIKQNNISDF
jgi:asparagine synthase (glutamine-hydrolysing)